MLEIFAMRHGQKGLGKNPGLTSRGAKQVADTTGRYLLDFHFDSIYHGDRRRHQESAALAGDILCIPKNRIFKTGLLSIESVRGYEDIDRCVTESLHHPDGAQVGFSIQNWNQMNSALMAHMRVRFLDFCNQARQGTILAISSSPLVEALHEKGFLVGEAGIVRYASGSNRVITPDEVVFEGYFD